MFSVLVSAWSVPSLNPDRGHCVFSIFVDTKLNTDSTSLHPGVKMGSGKFNAGGNWMD